MTSVSDALSGDLKDPRPSGTSKADTPKAGSRLRRKQTPPKGKSSLR